MDQQVLQSSRNGYPYQVLIVDDDPVHRALEREILDSSKYAVCEASSGREALAALRSRSFDVVLLDKRMPGMDGDEVCRRIRGELGLGMLPILMVTGDGDIDNLTLSLSAGASDFVRKPYQPSELLARLDAAVSHKRLTDQLDSAESMLFALARMRTNLPVTQREFPFPEGHTLVSTTDLKALAAPVVD